MLRSASTSDPLQRALIVRLWGEGVTIAEIVKQTGCSYSGVAQFASRHRDLCPIRQVQAPSKSPPVMTWTCDQEERLASLYASGISCLRIAAELGGGFTAAAVRRKVGRIGLPSRGHGWRPADRAPRKPKASAFNSKCPRLERKPGNVGTPQRAEKTKLVYVSPFGLAVGQDLPERRFQCIGDALIDLQAGCRWPMEHGGEHWFCGGDRHELQHRVSSYCAEHYALSTGKGTSPTHLAPIDANREAA